MAETADGGVPKSSTKNTKTPSNMQPVEANTDTSQLLLKELEHVFSLVGPAKEEITQLQQELTKPEKDLPNNTGSDDFDQLKRQLESAKRECAKLQTQLREEQNKNETRYKDISSELQNAYRKIRELEVTKDSVKEREDKMQANHKEEIDAYKEVIQSNEELLQSALKQVKEKEEREQQLERAYTNDIKKQQQEITKLTALLKSVKQEKEKLEKDHSDTQSRLSKLMGDKLSDNNPDIADLSDNNRPTKLAEKYQELYDNQWTDAYEVAEEYFSDMSEKVRIHVLIQILMRVYKYCKKEIAEQDKELLQVIYRTNATERESHDVPVDVKTHMKEIKRFTDTHVITNLTKRYIESLDTTKTLGAFIIKVEDFVQNCMTVCWPMVRQDPPLALHLNVQKGEQFDSSKYKHYTATGTIVDFVVWPALLLHQDGPILCKGVVQCTKPFQGSKSVKVRSRKVETAGIGIPTGSVRLTGTKTPVDTTKWFSDGISQAEENRTVVSSADTNFTNKSEQKQIQPNETARDLLDEQDFAPKQGEKQADKNASKYLNTEPQQPTRLNVPSPVVNKNKQNPHETGTYQEKVPEAGSYQQKLPPASSYQQNQQGAGNCQQNQPGSGNYQQNQLGTSSFQQNQHGAGYQQNQPGPGNYQQNQPGTGNYQQNQPGTGNYQQNQPGTGNYKQNQPRIGNCQQNQFGTGIYQQNQPGTGNQQNQPGTGNYQQKQPGIGNYQQNQSETSNYQQNQSGTGNYQNQPAAGSYQQIPHNASFNGSIQYSTQPSSGSLLQNQCAYTKFPQASSSVDQGDYQQQPCNTRTKTAEYPAHLLPTQGEFDSFIQYNNYYRNPNIARYNMGEQLYDKCRNYLAWLQSRQYFN